MSHHVEAAGTLGESMRSTSLVEAGRNRVGGTGTQADRGGGVSGATPENYVNASSANWMISTESTTTPARTIESAILTRDPGADAAPTLKASCLNSHRSPRGCSAALRSITGCISRLTR